MLVFYENNCICQSKTRYLVSTTLLQISLMSSLDLDCPNQLRHAIHCDLMFWLRCMRNIWPHTGTKLEKKRSATTL